MCSDPFTFPPTLNGLSSGERASRPFSPTTLNGRDARSPDRALTDFQVPVPAGSDQSRRIERPAALVGIELALDAIPEPRPFRRRDARHEVREFAVLPF